MKSTFTFFLLIVFLLTGGNEKAHAGASMVKNQVSGQTSIKKIQQAGSEINQQAILQSNNSGSEKQKDLVVFVEDKDDEKDDLIRKSNSQTISISTFFYAFVSSYSGNNPADRISTYNLPAFSGSCLYLEQRSLRI
ncbi:MAG: hypothetical protein LH478_09725 [Chitinophagaceae bacterium]|nr:hypothetical protein [Chitinophagaceae bacterium]